jgi:hypothetical protein
MGMGSLLEGLHRSEEASPFSPPGRVTDADRRIHNFR